MIRASMIQNGDKTVLDFASRPAFLLRSNELARMQLEMMMNTLLVKEAGGAWMEKTEV